MRAMGAGLDDSAFMTDMTVYILAVNVRSSLIFGYVLSVCARGQIDAGFLFVLSAVPRQPSAVLILVCKTLMNKPFTSAAVFTSPTAIKLIYFFFFSSLS